MSYIVAATDFSDVSENAVLYAAHLALSQNMELLIAHAYAFPVMIGDVPLPASLIDETQTDAETRMKGLMEKVALSVPGVAVKSHIAYGGIIDAINGHATENGKPWLITMGNSNTAEGTAWFFSTLKDAKNNLEYSVLAIPAASRYGTISKICLADDIRQNENTAALAKIAEVSLALKTELHVFNAQGDASYMDTAEVGTATKEILAAAAPHYHFRHQVIVDDAIHDFCADNDIDWLAVIPGKYSFFEELFHKSHTKALAKTMTIPLLILHEGTA